jgi:hypothetical protein
MDDNQESVKIRVRVKEKIPEEEREKRKKQPEALLWIIATVLLGILLGYLVTDQLLKTFRARRVAPVPSEEIVVRASEEKLFLEHEDLVFSGTPSPTPEKP